MGKEKSAPAFVKPAKPKLSKAERRELQVWIYTYALVSCELICYERRREQKHSNIWSLTLTRSLTDDTFGSYQYRRNNERRREQR